MANHSVPWHSKSGLGWTTFRVRAPYNIRDENLRPQHESKIDHSNAIRYVKIHGSRDNHVFLTYTHTWGRAHPPSEYSRLVYNSKWAQSRIGISVEGIG